ncbi:MAG: hypothetical protein KKD73_01465 [Proteobacteria bacterium]|nr:hypothetical protein [Pseudomonadota bacterium]MBU1641531.1 hypothetical protein [Pseudomonadota bacterium]
MTTDIIKHLFLTQAEDQQQARHKILHFLEHTELIRYEATTILDAEIISGANPTFWTQVDQGAASNRTFAKNLIVELEETGISRLQDLQDLPQGYPSKVLHTLVHILDGFIGADSAFYNLLEDSHWLSAKLRETIKESPEAYWLVPMLPGKLQYSVFHPKRP